MKKFVGFEITLTTVLSPSNVRDRLKEICGTEVLVSKPDVSKAYNKWYVQRIENGILELVSPKMELDASVPDKISAILRGVSDLRRNNDNTGVVNKYNIRVSASYEDKSINELMNPIHLFVLGYYFDRNFKANSKNFNIDHSEFFSEETSIKAFEGCLAREVNVYSKMSKFIVSMLDNNRIKSKFEYSKLENRGTITFNHLNQIHTPTSKDLLSLFLGEVDQFMNFLVTDGARREVSQTLETMFEKYRQSISERMKMKVQNIQRQISNLEKNERVLLELASRVKESLAEAD